MKCPTCGHDDAGLKFLVNANALTDCALVQPLIVTNNAGGNYQHVVTIAPNAAGCAAPLTFIQTIRT